MWITTTSTEPEDICVLCRQGWNSVELYTVVERSAEPVSKTSNCVDMTEQPVREISGAPENQDSLGSTTDGNPRDLISNKVTTCGVEDSTTEQFELVNESKIPYLHFFLHFACPRNSAIVTSNFVFLISTLSKLVASIKKDNQIRN